MATDNMTKLANLIVPEVMADMIEGKLPYQIKFAPLAHIDNTLVGVPGDTITVPKFAYIGDAEIVAEGVAMGTTKLTATSTKATVKKAGKAVELTDEAVLSGYGDPVGEANRQLGMAIASRLDADIIDALKTAKLEVDKSSAPLDYAAVVDAIDLLAEEDAGEKVLFIHPTQASALRKSSEFIDRNKYGGEVMITGTIGKIAGADVVISKRVPKDGENYINFIVGKGAVTVYLKRETLVEKDRDILAKTTVISADKHYVVALSNDSKVVKIKAKA